jgi:hypothetical protein
MSVAYVHAVPKVCSAKGVNDDDEVHACSVFDQQ